MSVQPTTSTTAAAAVAPQNSAGGGGGLGGSRSTPWGRAVEEAAISNQSHSATAVNASAVSPAAASTLLQPAVASNRATPIQQQQQRVSTPMGSPSPVSVHATASSNQKGGGVAGTTPLGYQPQLQHLGASANIGPIPSTSFPNQQQQQQNGNTSAAPTPMQQRQQPVSPNHQSLHSLHNLAQNSPPMVAYSQHSRPHSGGGPAAAAAVHREASSSSSVAAMNSIKPVHSFHSTPHLNLNGGGGAFATGGGADDFNNTIRSNFPVATAVAPAVNRQLSDRPPSASAASSVASQGVGGAAAVRNKASLSATEAKLAMYRTHSTRSNTNSRAAAAAPDQHSQQAAAAAVARAASVQGYATAMTPIASAPSHLQLQSQRMQRESKKTGAAANTINRSKDREGSPDDLVLESSASPNHRGPSGNSYQSSPASTTTRNTTTTNTSSQSLGAVGVRGGPHQQTKGGGQRGATSSSTATRTSATVTRLVATRKVKAIDFLRRSLLPLNHRGDLTRDDMVVVCSAVTKDYLPQCGCSEEELHQTTAEPLSKADEQLLTTLLLVTLKDLSAIKKGRGIVDDSMVEMGAQTSQVVTPQPSVKSNHSQQQQQQQQLSRQETQHSSSANTSHLPYDAQQQQQPLQAAPHNGNMMAMMMQQYQQQPVAGVMGGGVPLFQSVSYTITGVFPRSANSSTYYYQSAVGSLRNNIISGSGGGGGGGKSSDSNGTSSHRRRNSSARRESVGGAGGASSAGSAAGGGASGAYGVNTATMLRVTLNSPTIQDADTDVVVIGSVSSVVPVSLTWWLAYGPQKSVLNLDKMYTNGQVCTYQISDASFILSFKHGALVAGWDYFVYLGVTNEDGTSVSAITTFVIPSLSADGSDMTAIMTQAGPFDADASRRRGQQLIQTLQQTKGNNPYTGRTHAGYYGDGDINEDEHLARLSRFGPPTGYAGSGKSAAHNPDATGGNYDVYHGSATTAPKYGDVVMGKPRDAMGGTSAYYDQHDYHRNEQRQEEREAIRREKELLQAQYRGFGEGADEGAMMGNSHEFDMGRSASEQHNTNNASSSSPFGGRRASVATSAHTRGSRGTADKEPVNLAKLGMRGQLNPYFVPPVPPMAPTYQEQLRHFFIEQIEPLYYLSPNPAMPEEAFKAIVKDTARRYWFAYDASQELTDALKREILEQIKLRISYSMLMPPQQREQLYAAEKARAEEEMRKQREALRVIEARQGSVASGLGGVAGGGQIHYNPATDSAYYGINGASSDMASSGGGVDVGVGGSLPRGTMVSGGYQ